MVTISSGEYKIFKIKDDQHGSSCVFTSDGQYVFVKVVSPKEPTMICRINVGTSAVEEFYRSAKKVVEDDYLSSPEVVEFEVLDDSGTKDKAYGYYYPPKVYSPNFLTLISPFACVFLKFYNFFCCFFFVKIDISGFKVFS